MSSLDPVDSSLEKHSYKSWFHIFKHHHPQAITLFHFTDRTGNPKQPFRCLNDYNVHLLSCFVIASRPWDICLQDRTLNITAVTSIIRAWSVESPMLLPGHHASAFSSTIFACLLSCFYLVLIHLLCPPILPATG